MDIEHRPKPITKLQRSGKKPYASQRGGFHVCAKNHMPLIPLFISSFQGLRNYNPNLQPHISMLRSVWIE
jgi:hypothetical protein